MNSSDRHNSEYEDDNALNTESSNTPSDSKEQDDKNIESLFETPDLPNKSSEDDLLSLFANSGMLEDNSDLFNSPEMMSIEENTDLFIIPDMKEETSEMDLFSNPEMMSTSNELDSNQFDEMDLFNSPEMMSIEENTDLFIIPDMKEETSEMDLFNNPEMMSTGNELDSNQFDEIDILATPEMMLIGEETSEMDLFNNPEMMLIGEETDILATPEMMLIGEETSEMSLFDTPEMMSTSNVDSDQFDEIDILATPEMMSISGEVDINQPEEIGKETSEIDLLAYHELASQTDNVNQSVEVDSELDSSQQLEIIEETNDMNLGLGVAAIAVGATIPLLEERLIVDINKQKIGEVVVRKEIETEMVQVPIRREKLIVEQVGAETIQLAEIDLGSSDQVVELATMQANMAQVGSVAKSNEIIVSGEFTSAKIASLLLNAIALERNQGCKKIRIEIVVDNAERQQTYQEWVDRCSIKPSKK